MADGPMRSSPHADCPQRLGIMGGTFDPPHEGHVALARGVADALGLERVLFMPTGNPNFKRGQTVTLAKQRAEMVALAIAGQAGFELDMREVVRTGVTYTADTLQEMHAQLPETRLFFIMGADSALTLPQWRRAGEFAGLCTFVAVQRPGYDFAHVRQVLEGSSVHFAVYYLEIDTPDVSSTQLRERISRGENVDGLVAPSVMGYIEEHGLYR